MSEVPIGKILLIDGDSIPFIIGWNNKDHTDVPVVRAAVRTFISDLFTFTGAQQYLGVLAAAVSNQCFRHSIYKYNRYKGSRGEKEDWVKYWDPIIRKILFEEWNFQQAPAHLETDDVIATLGENNSDTVICSPDKDLKQISGWFYNFKEMGQVDKKPFTYVSTAEANRNFLIQLLTGDSSDSVNGVSGMGPVNAKKLLDAANSFTEMLAVKNAYQKQYGPYYGPTIYDETYYTLRMMTPSNDWWHKYGFDIEEYRKFIRNTPRYESPFCEESQREESV